MKNLPIEIQTFADIIQNDYLYVDKTEKIFDLVKNPILNALWKGNQRIHRASVLKDEFEHFWNYKARWADDRFIKRWTTTALKSRLKPIRRFVKTIREHMHRILPYVETRMTNAIPEGLNRNIKIVKNRASGFRTLDAYTDLIFLNKVM